MTTAVKNAARSEPARAAAPAAPDASTTDKAIDAIHCAGAALERAEKERKEWKSAMDKAASALPDVVRRCVAAGLVEPHESEDLKRALSDHSSCLEFLGKFASHHAEVVSAASNAPTKEASEQAMGRPYSGANGRIVNGQPAASNGRMKESDRTYFRMLGIHVPDDA